MQDHLMGLMRYWGLAKRKLLFDPAKTLAVARGDAVRAYWSNRGGTVNNFGDQINPIVLQYLSGKTAIHSDAVFYFSPVPTIYCIGSTLDNLSERNAIVAGAGFKWPRARPFLQPMKIIAVRGPLTKRKFDEIGTPCASLFLDPGLLVNKVFPDSGVGKESDMGIICHYADKADCLARPVISRGRSYRWIDIEAPPAQVVQEILSCRRIASSSLHGIIAAHSYGIPAVWLCLSDRVGGGGFKFRDYYGSLGVEEPDCYRPDEGIDLAIVEKLARAFEIESMINNYVEAFRAGTMDAL